MAPFTIYVECTDPALWRYNYVVMGSVRRGGVEVDFVKHRSVISPVDEWTRPQPKGYNAERSVVLKSKEGDELTLYIYVVPYTLPIEQSTVDMKPLVMGIKVEYGDAVVVERSLEINPWSGDNIEITYKA